MSPEFISFINQLTTLFTGLGVLVAALVSVVKPFRLWFINKLSYKAELQAVTDSLAKVDQKIDAESAKQELVKNATLALTRNSLTRIYFKSLEHGGISAYDRENFIKMYDSYKALGGNSYVHEIYEQVLKMDTLTIEERSKASRKRRTVSKTAKRK